MLINVVSTLACTFFVAKRNRLQSYNNFLVCANNFIKNLCIPKICCTFALKSQKSKVKSQMMKRSALLILCLATACAYVQAEYIVEIKETKKVIHVDQLGLSSSANVRDALDMMPSLLGRNTTNIIDNFSVQIDGQSVGNSTDVVLVQTLLAEVDVIEISTSPTASEQKNGQGGVINIKLKEADEGFHGDVLFDATTEWDVMPSVLMSYKKNNWSFRGSMMMEYYRPTTSSYTEQYSPSALLMSIDTMTERYRQETAKFYAKYQTKSDELKINVWESLAYGNEDKLNYLCHQTTPDLTQPSIIKQITGTDTTAISQRQLSVVANFDYKHTFSNNGTLNANARYDYSPENSSNEMRYDSQYYRLLNGVIGGADVKYLSALQRQPHQLSAELKTKHKIGDWNETHYLELECGANYELGASSTKNDEQRWKEGTRHLQPDTRLYHTLSHYVSPFLTFTYQYQTLRIELGGRYQYKQQRVSDNIKTYQNAIDTTTNIRAHDWTANASFNWQVVPHHNLRLIAARNIIRPSVEQLSPIAYYNNHSGKQIKGNPDLQSTSIYNIELNYTHDFKNDKHNLLFDAGLNYIRTENPIVQVMREDASRKTIYTTYINDNGKPSNILNLNLLLCYQVGVYTMLLTGNTFYKMQHVGEDVHARLYYNVALSNNFNFAKGWAFSFKLSYNSEEWMMNEIKGDCFLANLRLAKQWGNWIVHAEINDVFNYLSTDISKNGEETILRQYDPHIQAVALGFAYKW